MADRDHTPDDRSGRGTDDDIGQVVGYARTAQPASEPEQPGNEVFAAPAQHEGPVLAYSERRSSGNGYGWLSIDADVRLRAPRPHFA
jgi:hypothetical protein